MCVIMGTCIVFCLCAASMSLCFPRTRWPSVHLHSVSFQVCNSAWGCLDGSLSVCVTMSGYDSGSGQGPDHVCPSVTVLSVSALYALLSLVQICISIVLSVPTAVVCNLRLEPAAGCTCVSPLSHGWARTSPDVCCPSALLDLCP